MYFICWRHLSSFVCCFSEKFITSITTTNSILIAELMLVRKSLHSLQCCVYTSCIKKRKGRNSASDGNCCQITIFIMKRELDFQDQQRKLAGQAGSQDLRSHTSGQGLGRRKKSEMGRILPQGAKMRGWSEKGHNRLQAEWESGCEGEHCLMLVTPSCHHVCIPLHLSSDHTGTCVLKTAFGEPRSFDAVSRS